MPPDTAAESPPKYKDASRLALIIQILLVIYVLLPMGDGLFTASMQVLQLSNYDQELQTGADLVKALILGVGALNDLFLYVIFIVWFRRVRRNLDAAGIIGLKSKSRDCVLGFIIPGYSLYEPIVVAEEIWRSTTPKLTDPLEWKRVQVNVLYMFWWLSFCGESIAFKVMDMTTKAATKGDVFHPTLNCYYATYACDTMKVIVGILAIFVVRSLTAREKAKYLESTQRERPTPNPIQ